VASDSLYKVAWQFYGPPDARKPPFMPVVISLWTRSDQTGQM
jgi:hypothetical protein